MGRSARRGTAQLAQVSIGPGIPTTTMAANAVVSVSRARKAVRGICLPIGLEKFTHCGRPQVSAGRAINKAGRALQVFRISLVTATFRLGSRIDRAFPGTCDADPPRTRRRTVELATHRYRSANCERPRRFGWRRVRANSTGNSGRSARTSIALLVCSALVCPTWVPCPSRKLRARFRKLPGHSEVGQRCAAHRRRTAPGDALSEQSFRATARSRYAQSIPGAHRYNAQW
ncbi:hypothetical protein ABIA39_008533 [Nocardia sp. GAS34]